MNEIILYQTEDNEIQIEVQFEQDTVWLNRQQLATLFDRDIKTVGKHINNVFNEGELEKEVVVAKFATTTQHGAIKGKTQTQNTEYYNLDVVISVGYRVNSKRGTQFRQWATQRLKDFLVKDVAINQKRLDELQQTVQLIQKAVTNETNANVVQGLLKIITQYTQSFILLNQYDSNAIEQKDLMIKLITQLINNN